MMRGLLLCLLLLVLHAGEVSAQDARPAPLGPPRPAAAPPPGTAEVPTVEADVSTRTLEVTTGFTGHEIVVFGAVDNSQAPPGASGYYDAVIVLEGTPMPLVVRRKSDVAGVWINTSSVTFAAVPSFYAIASTRPLEEIASPEVLERHAIGFQHIKMTPSVSAKGTLDDLELTPFREAVTRLKKREKLFVIKPRDGVTFVGRSLFRATIPLPANVPVGPLVARTYLFRDGEVVSAQISRVSLHRAGLERLVHNFAFIYPATYGLAAVLLAIASGLLASAYFRRQPG